MNWFVGLKNRIANKKVSIRAVAEGPVVLILLAVAMAMVLKSQNALAMVQSGQFTGVDKSGAACGFTLKTVWFENDRPHPLNERLPLHEVSFTEKTFDPLEWVLAHVQVVDHEKGSVGFEHSQFRQVLPTRTGAQVMVLEIDETERPEGHTPKRLIYFENNFRKPELNVYLECVVG